ncbi:MAG: hypothetical protein ACR2PL_06300 [Dehalococcoidia bacterium]
MTLKMDQELDEEPIKPEDEAAIEIRNRDEIPHFVNENEEAAFWSTHALSPHLFTRRGPSPRVRRLVGLGRQ